MTVNSLHRHIAKVIQDQGRFDHGAVEELIDRAEDWWHVSKGEERELKQLLTAHADKFEPSAQERLRNFLGNHAKGSPLERLLEIVASVPALIELPVEIVRSAIGTLFADGTPSAAEIQKVRDAARPLGVRGSAGLAKIAPDAGVKEVEAAMRQAIKAIDGFSFLSRPPAGHSDNKHVVLIKPGINWGQFGYPTVTSWESTYASTKMTLEEGARRGAEVEVIVGDESGIEIKMWGGSTLKNMEHTGILHGAVLAGLERAAQLEVAQLHAKNPSAELQGAGQLLARARKLDRIGLDDKDMIEMARRAGVRVIGFDEAEHTRIPVPGARHFKDGILVPRVVAEEVTDIINLPKPPGRHMIMGCSGLTGAVKNHVGLLGASDRSPALHGPFDRFPALNDGETGDSYLDRLGAYKRKFEAGEGAEVARELATKTKLDPKGMGPGGVFHEKLVELYLAFKDKERFTVTDMRRTVSSVGPDLGDQVDVGAVVAARDPVTVDALAGALLKKTYDDMGGPLDTLAPGGDTFTEYLAGRTWLGEGSAFDVTSHIAANAYGQGPVDLEHVDLLNADDSGFSGDELERMRAYMK